MKLEEFVQLDVHPFRRPYGSDSFRLQTDHCVEYQWAASTLSLPLLTEFSEELLTVRHRSAVVPSPQIRSVRNLPPDVLCGLPTLLEGSSLVVFALRV
jgi:hypothetical protein